MFVVISLFNFWNLSQPPQERQQWTVVISSFLKRVNRLRRGNNELWLFLYS